jgi:thiosulfate/3-mercaptopyruvate sulfurtransferase
MSSTDGFTTLISVAQLQALQISGQALMVFDCSCDLMQPAMGAQQYAQAHLPGARFADLNAHLSAKGDPAVTGAASGGRHPLPSREAFAAWLGAQGVSPAMQVVVYDRQGCNYCGRLWWMLRWLGHANVAVLDGGWQAWIAAGGVAESGDPALPHSAPPGQHSTTSTAFSFPLKPGLVALADVASVASQLTSPSQTVIDARGAPRFRGEVEPIDPVAGHIPGALNRPFTHNLDADGFFKPADQLRQEFLALLGDRDPATVVHHCGSGVSAVPNVLAMEIAGLGATALFAGSWSEWCADPSRPVARG